MSRSALSEQVNRLLPGEKWKRVREAILQSATYSGQRLDTLRRNIDQENRLKDGKLQDGNLEFPDSTTAELDLFVWTINYQIFQPGFTSIPVTPHNPDYPRPDIFTGDNAGNIKYYAGSIDSEGNGQFPDIPEGEILLREVIRNTNGSNDSTPGNGGGGNFVSKSATGNQTIKSDLSLSVLSGGNLDYLRTDPNGKLQLVRGDKVGLRVTEQGTVGWARVLSINCNHAVQLNYGLTLELNAVESNDFQTAKLSFYIRFNGAGVIQDSTCLLFGKVTPTRYKIVKISTTVYELWLQHATTLSMYIWRPLMSFGSVDKYTFYHREPILALPAGDLLDFEEYGDLSEIIAAITTIESDLTDLESQVQDIETNLDENYYSKTESDPEDSTGSIIAFDKPRTYNSPGSPNTNATITEENIPFRKVTQVIFHQAASFNPPATWEKSTGSDDYDPAKINVIYVEAFSATYKRYIIDHDE